jgi:hypothetical protein
MKILHNYGEKSCMNSLPTMEIIWIDFFLLRPHARTVGGGNTATGLP